MVGVPPNSEIKTVSFFAESPGIFVNEHLLAKGVTASRALGVLRDCAPKKEERGAAVPACLPPSLPPCFPAFIPFTKVTILGLLLGSGDTEMD